MIEIKKHCEICNRRSFATFVPKQHTQSIVAACVQCGNMMVFDCYGVSLLEKPYSSKTLTILDKITQDSQDLGMYADEATGTRSENETA